MRQITQSINGAELNAEEAYRVGLVNRVYPGEELLDRADYYQRAVRAFLDGEPLKF